jgi:undecaprenyl-diphosphatase
MEKQRGFRWKHWSVIRFMGWLGQHERGLLITIALLAAGIWAFAELADNVIEGETGEFDREILLALRNPADLSDPIGPHWLEEMVRDMTALGGMGVLGLLVIAVLGFLLLRGQVRNCIFVALAVGSGFLLSLWLKEAFERPRPDLVPHGSYVHTASFPSGHSMLSALTYLTLGALLARVQPRRRIKAYLILNAVFLTILVGVSRVYLGVHWPTDVLSGWTAGAVWAILCWEVARRLEKSGQVEGLDGTDPNNLNGRALPTPPKNAP